MQQPTLEQVDAYAGPELLVPRLEQQHGYTNEQASALFREAKRMLYLHAQTKQPVSPSESVDDAWHEMLMFTKFYRDFCQFLGVFIHHDPSPGPPDGGKTYKNTKEIYQKTFGIAPDPQYWP